MMASLAVGVCTYKRPKSLMRLIEHLAQCDLPSEIGIIVVDNDGSDPSLAVHLAELGSRIGLRLHGRIERRPGISAARNAVFDIARQLGTRFLALIDDDEWPSKQWLTSLLQQQSLENAAVVGGPMRPVFPVGAAHLQKYSRFWSVDRQWRDGRPFVFSTGNALIDLEQLRGMEWPLFDEAFGLTGGGDTVFFRRLFRADLRMAWAEEALVYEEVPAERASLAWMRRRRFRVGNHAVRWERLDASGWRTFGKTLGLTARLPLYPLLRREPEAPLIGWLLEFDKLRGRYAAHGGDIVTEYAR